jgi:hypothetical protein
MKMTRVRVLYWKEIPVQVQSEDENGRVSRPLQDRFQKAADLVAMSDGSHGTEEYLEAWEFGPYQYREEPAVDAADCVARSLELIPKDFVIKIINMQKNGTRNPLPGAIDHWA